MIKKPFKFIIDDRRYWFLPSSILRRDILLNDGLLDESISIAEDIDVLARMALAGPITLCSAQLVTIYRRNETIEHLVSQRLKKTEYSYRAYEKVYAGLLNRSDLSIPERAFAARIRCSNLRALGNMLLRSGRKFEARQIFKKAVCAYSSLRALIKYFATFLPQNLSLLFVRRTVSPAGNEDQPEKDPAHHFNPKKELRP